MASNFFSFAQVDSKTLCGLFRLAVDISPTQHLLLYLPLVSKTCIKWLAPVKRAPSRLFWSGFTLFVQGFYRLTISGIRKIGKYYSKELCV